MRSHADSVTVGASEDPEVLRPGFEFQNAHCCLNFKTRTVTCGVSRFLLTLWLPLGLILFLLVLFLLLSSR